MKKFEFHLDALVTVCVVFALAAVFMIYQRHQYAILAQENAGLLWENSGLEANLVHKSKQFEKCQSLIASMTEAVDVSN